MIEVVLPMNYPYQQLVFATYSFALNGSSMQQEVAYLNGTALAAAVVNMTITQPPTYGWRVLVVRLPGNVADNEGLHGIALVVSCTGGSYNVTDFVCYGDPVEYPTNSPVPTSGLARGKGCCGSGTGCFRRQRYLSITFSLPPRTVPNYESTAHT